ncbi:MULTISPECIES: hypothetical protein [unclassified Streptomyces]|uniref:hypothetical protein n=1 Tax=unclassified Streptomyces TaxID=2593676 RepID=UPI0038268180
MNDDTREFLTALLDAINLPSPATYGDHEAFQRVLEDRALDAVVALSGVLGEPADADWGLGWHTAYLREQVAKKPVITYLHFDAAGGAV